MAKNPEGERERAREDQGRLPRKELDWMRARMRVAKIIPPRPTDEQQAHQLAVVAAQILQDL